MMSSTPAMPFASSLVLPEAFAKDAILAWYRGEFAAANAIIDALCHHLTQILSLDKMPEYQHAFAAIHRRRLNWIPVLQMQTYYSISEITAELQRLASDGSIHKRQSRFDEVSIFDEGYEKKAFFNKQSHQGILHQEGLHEQKTDKEAGSFGGNDREHHIDGIKMTKGFVAKEPVRGNMVNVVKGLKLYKDVFTQKELSRLSNCINELYVAGRKGKLSGETYILFNKQLKANKREIIQLGVPIFGPRKDDSADLIEPIPPLIQEVIDQLVQSGIVPVKRRPNGCIINFFDKDEYSQPYMKPPHLDQPVSTLILSDTMIVFGRILTVDENGNAKGSLTLSLKEGALLIMRGNSADMARYAVCATPNNRISVTFFKVRMPHTSQFHQTTMCPLIRTMNLWQSGRWQPRKLNKAISSMSTIPQWGAMASSFVFVSPRPRVAINQIRQVPSVGTGVFLPRTARSRKTFKHLPPRIQRVRQLPIVASSAVSNSEDIP